jgi:ribonuclease HII
MTTVYVDEVGCASIAGPVLVCAVAPGKIKKIAGVNDSKKVSKKKRESLYPLLQNIPHVFATSPPKRIEEINIHWAKYEIMKTAVEGLISKGIEVKKVIVDGKFTIPDLDIEQEAVIKADAKFWEVGAASILAKVKRDRMMADLAKLDQYSHYDWENNAGYYTPNHRLGIILHGPTDLHRKKYDYFQYCLARHRKCQEFIKNGHTEAAYFAWEAKQIGDSNKSDYTLWKEAKKKKWKQIPFKLER